MSTTTTDPTNRRGELVAWAAELGHEIAVDAARHDTEGSFVSEAYDLLRSSGYLALAVPEELGGRGATIAEVAMAQRELAHHCGSIALAGVEVCDLAMEVGGGAAFCRSSPIERCYRDVRGAKLHPFTPEETLVHAGKVALGMPADER